MTTILDNSKSGTNGLPSTVHEQFRAEADKLIQHDGTTISDLDRLVDRFFPELTQPRGGK